eukprot:Opistho-1_new@44104
MWPSGPGRQWPEVSMRSWCVLHSKVDECRAELPKKLSRETGLCSARPSREFLQSEVTILALLSRAGTETLTRNLSTAAAAMPPLAPAARQVALAPEQQHHGQRHQQHGGTGPPETGLGVDQRDEVEVHAKNAGNQVQRQEHGGERGEHPHHVVGAVGGGRKMHLDRRLQRLLQPLHVRQHALDVLDGVARADLQHLALHHRKVVLVQGLQPLGQRGALVFAHLLQLVQRVAAVQQRLPVGETRARVEQFRLPAVELAGEAAAQLQVAVDHAVDDAQHQLRRAGGHAHQPLALARCQSGHSATVRVAPMYSALI